MAYYDLVPYESSFAVKKLNLGNLGSVILDLNKVVQILF